MKHSEFLKIDKELQNFKMAALDSELKVQTQMLSSSSTQQSQNIVKANYSVSLLLSKHMLLLGYPPLCLITLFISTTVSKKDISLIFINIHLLDDY